MKLILASFCVLLALIDDHASAAEPKTCLLFSIDHGFGNGTSANGPALDTAEAVQYIVLRDICVELPLPETLPISL